MRQDGIVRVVGAAELNAAIAVSARSWCGSATTASELSLDWVIGPGRYADTADPFRLEVARYAAAYQCVHVGNAGRGGIVLAASAADGLGAVCVARRLADGRQSAARAAWEDAATSVELALRGYALLASLAATKGHAHAGAAMRARFEGTFLPALAALHAEVRGAHWYVGLMAVEPSAQGQGLCGRLMRAVSRAADAEGLPCYLETSGARNRAIYERFGYRAVRQVALRPSAGDEAAGIFDELYAMVRPARPATAAAPGAT
jgi:predicted N-acetyltransferase YhbS